MKRVNSRDDDAENSIMCMNNMEFPCGTCKQIHTYGASVCVCRMDGSLSENRQTQISQKQCVYVQYTEVGSWDGSIYGLISPPPLHTFPPSGDLFSSHFFCVSRATFRSIRFFFSYQTLAVHKYYAFRWPFCNVHLHTFVFFFLRPVHCIYSLNILCVCVRGCGCQLSFSYRL